MESVALIWGAGGGIGSALVSHLRKMNWEVLAAGRGVSNNPILPAYAFLSSAPVLFGCNTRAFAPARAERIFAAYQEGSQGRLDFS
jgi:NAD(P)-dependent dehydrogenase (short-subunit alcohol dehydrogenase family)